MKILILADNASDRMGGEAYLPIHYFKHLLSAESNVYLITHERCRDDLQRLFPDTLDRVFFLSDGRLPRLIYRLGRHLPYSLQELLIFPLISLLSEVAGARVARRLVEELEIDIVHRPTPVSPRWPMRAVNAPTVVGPMNGGMSYPPGLSGDYGRGKVTLNALSRGVAELAGLVLDGKPRAARLLVANERTRASLPRSCRGADVEVLSENAVDLQRWTARTHLGDGPAVFVHVGRLVWCKAVDIAIEALARIPDNSRLLIVGDGADRPSLEALADQLGLSDGRCAFLGFQPHEKVREILHGATALLLPSVRECGGAVILEAMAAGVTPIATAWGGPQDYIDGDTGFLIEPISRQQMIEDFAARMTLLARDRTLALEKGFAARRRVEQKFTWEAKICRMQEIYAATLDECLRAAPNMSHAPRLSSRRYRSERAMPEPSE